MKMTSSIHITEN